MNPERKYEPIKESRDWGFVEYHAPMKGYKFASLNLVIIEDISKDEVVNTIEKELESWLTRYPIPLFVSAFDDKGELIQLDEIRPCNHLIGFLDQNGKIILNWRLLKDDEISDVALNQEYFDNLYSNLDLKTYTELDIDRRKRRRQIQVGSFIIFIWLIIIPLIVVLLDFYSDWVSLVVLIYSFYKALQKTLELTGSWPKTKRRKEKELEEQLKGHYYYHCQMNPEGFRRLRQENFEKLAKDGIAREARSLKTGMPSS
jgi:hypothetical protein